MTASAPEGLGSIFTNAAAYADPVGWHQRASQIRRESPVLRVAEDGDPEDQDG